MATLFTFVLCLGAFVAIGLASLRYSKSSRSDYYLASRQVTPWLAGLSAVATNNSGYMFIGVIGFTYSIGLAAIWLMIGWLLGDFCASLFVHRKLRVMTEESNEASFAAVMARWSGGPFRHWQRLAALVSIIFLGAYSAAQIAAGSKALEGVLGWDPRAGAVMSAVLILAYSAAGGIRASIWTDAAQSFVMLGAMVLLFVVAIVGRGGVDATVAQMGAIPGFLDIFPPNLLLPGIPGVALFVLGWMAAGFSVIGQPHIMVRFMALRDPSDIVETRFWYYGYFALFYGLATGVGLMSRLYLPNIGTLDPELALPTMAVMLLPPLLVGLILAGIFAATMSTADSLVLSCSAAITHDLAPNRLERPWMMKLATAGVTLSALVLALSGNQSVFSLVILAWSTLACTFGPLLVLFALGRRVSEPVAIALMILGVAIALAWRQAGWQLEVYEGLPGMLIPTVIGFFLSRRESAPELDAALAEPAD